MTTHNPANERIKRAYFAFLKESQGHSEDTVDAVASALARFEGHTKLRNFNAFHYEQAIAFKRHLAGQDSRSTAGKLSKATLRSTLAHLKRFFQWLSDKPGCKSRFRYSDAEYFNLSDNDSRIATARRQRCPTTIRFQSEAWSRSLARFAGSWLWKISYTNQQLLRIAPSNSAA